MPRLSTKTLEMLTDMVREIPGPRCTHVSGGVRCCREPDHGGPHMYRCASERCPGYPWRASNTPHPVETCR